MVDRQTVCCLCGDVGFPDKLFRCCKCLNRFQHSYCSNYYSESSEPIEQCDWCQSDEIRRSSSRRGGATASTTSSTKKSVARNDAAVANTTSRSDYSGGDKIKHHHHHHHDNHREDQSNAAASDQKGKNPTTGAPSPRPGTRRYKLLKDVMC